MMSERMQGEEVQVKKTRLMGQCGKLECRGANETNSSSSIDTCSCPPTPTQNPPTGQTGTERHPNQAQATSNKENPPRRNRARNIGGLDREIPEYELLALGVGLPGGQQLLERDGRRRRRRERRSELEVRGHGQRGLLV